MFLDVDQLCVSYPKRANPSVDRVTLGLHAGQMGVLIGSSGCGKTSLLRAALLTGDWQVVCDATEKSTQAASGIVSAYCQWHIERGLKSLQHVERN